MNNKDFFISNRCSILFFLFIFLISTPIFADTEDYRVKNDDNPALSEELKKESEIIDEAYLSAARKTGSLDGIDSVTHLDSVDHQDSVDIVDHVDGPGASGIDMEAIDASYFYSFRHFRQDSKYNAFGNVHEGYEPQANVRYPRPSPNDSGQPAVAYTPQGHVVANVEGDLTGTMLMAERFGDEPMVWTVDAGVIACPTICHKMDGTHIVYSKMNPDTLKFELWAAHMPDGAMDWEIYPLYGDPDWDCVWPYADESSMTNELTFVFLKSYADESDYFCWVCGYDPYYFVRNLMFCPLGAEPPVMSGDICAVSVILDTSPFPPVTELRMINFMTEDVWPYMHNPPAGYIGGASISEWFGPGKIMSYHVWDPVNEFLRVEIATGVVDGYSDPPVSIDMFSDPTMDSFYPVINGDINNDQVALAAYQTAENAPDWDHFDLILTELIQWLEPEPTPEPSPVPTPYPTPGQPMDICPGEPIMLNTSIMHETFTMMPDYFGSCNVLSIEGPDAVWQLPLDTTVLELEICLTGTYDTVLYLKQFECETGLEMECDNNTYCTNDEWGCPPMPFSSHILIPYVEPGLYFIFVDGAPEMGPPMGEYCLRVSGIPLTESTDDSEQTRQVAEVSKSGNRMSKSPRLTVKQNQTSKVNTDKVDYYYRCDVSLPPAAAPDGPFIVWGQAKTSPEPIPVLSPDQLGIFLVFMLLISLAIYRGYKGYRETA